MEFKINCLQYAYTTKGLVNIDDADKFESYFLDKELSIPLTYCSGEKNVPYWRKVSNISAEELKRVFGNSESVEHYNKKIELASGLELTDYSYRKLMYKAHSSKTEYYIKEINKIVDVALFDKDGELLICIEVYYTNKKTQKDIDKFNSLNIIVYEYDIQKNRCYPISAGESYQDEYYENRERINKSREYIQEQRKEIKRFKNVPKEYYEIKESIEFTKSEIKSQEEQIRYIESKIRPIEIRLEKTELIKSQLKLSWKDIVNKHKEKQ